MCVCCCVYGVGRVKVVDCFVVCRKESSYVKQLGALRHLTQLNWKSGTLHTPSYSSIYHGRPQLGEPNTNSGFESSHFKAQPCTHIQLQNQRYSVRVRSNSDCLISCFATQLRRYGSLILWGDHIPVRLWYRWLKFWRNATAIEDLAVMSNVICICVRNLVFLVLEHRTLKWWWGLFLCYFSFFLFSFVNFSFVWDTDA